MAGAAGLAAGCADDNSSLFIYGVQYPVPPGCFLIADPTQRMLDYGYLDLAIRSNYIAWLLVGNQLTPRGAKLNTRTETMQVSLSGAEVQLTDSQGNALADKFSVYGSGFATPSKSETPGLGLFAAQLIPDPIGQKFKDPSFGVVGTTTLKQVIAKVRVFGQTTGNQDVESAELSFPISVCYGCLISYPVSSLSADGTQCVANATTGGGGQVVSCNVGQDDIIPCTLCAATLDVCKNVPKQTP